MNIEVIDAKLKRNEDKRFIGKVHFNVEGHKEPYELTLDSKNRKDWGYSLHYFAESGPDGEIEKVDLYLEENEEAFNLLVEAAENAFEE
jgi:hypothetical protein